MGLTIPARGVQPPTLDFELDHFQLKVLEELGQNTVSPNSPIFPTGRTSTTTIAGGASVFTPVAAEVGASAFIPVAVWGEQFHRTWPPYFLCECQHYTFSGK
jgi:hypothetical protein